MAEIKNRAGAVVFTWHSGTHDFDAADLPSVNLAGAVLEGADLRGANLGLDNLGAATQLQEAVFSRCQFGGASFYRAVIDRTTILPEGFNPEDHGIVWFG